MSPQCLCMCVCVLYVSCSSVSASVWRLTFSVSLSCCLPRLLFQTSKIIFNCAFYRYVRALQRPEALGCSDLASSAPRHGDYRHMPPYQCFYVGSGDQTLVLVFARQALYLLSHLPALTRHFKSTYSCSFWKETEKYMVCILLHMLLSFEFST